MYKLMMNYSEDVVGYAATLIEAYNFCQSLKLSPKENPVKLRGGFRYQGFPEIKMIAGYWTSIDHKIISIKKMEPGEEIQKSFVLSKDGHSLVKGITIDGINFISYEYSAFMKHIPSDIISDLLNFSDGIILTPQFGEDEKGEYFTLELEVEEYFGKFFEEEEPFLRQKYSLPNEIIFRMEPYAIATSSPASEAETTLLGLLKEIRTESIVISNWRRFGHDRSYFSKVDEFYQIKDASHVHNLGYVDNKTGEFCPA